MKKKCSYCGEPLVERGRRICRECRQDIQAVLDKPIPMRDCGLTVKEQINKRILERKSRCLLAYMNSLQQNTPPYLSYGKQVAIRDNIGYFK